MERPRRREQDSPDLNAEKIKLSKRIVTSVARNGLVSSDTFGYEGEQMLTSTTPVAVRPGIIHMHTLRTPEDVDKHLYRRILTSVFPVMFERPREPVPETHNLPDDILADRAKNTLLVVATDPSLENIIHETRVKFYNPATGTIEERGEVQESKTDSPLSTSLLSHFLLPDELHQELLLDDPRVRTVGYITHEVVGSPGRSLVVPDYEAELRQIMAATGTPVYIHGVRLPTVDDMQHLHDLQRAQEIEIDYTMVSGDVDTAEPAVGESTNKTIEETEANTSFFRTIFKRNKSK